ncbi:hypothetical protein Ae201684P_010522 [Aphanomyces euteiches]|uniref:Uncharacterized protein n=1 Tax=Aphanomyces euteiches TaxID=100861 RepID=A0A6G0WBA6_9STRA|nr:hypothetical protein Ae201684_016856 [Aphanomyces euteiches]KAH9076582.1 hypothetical protein Ae201684P_010522 [Aphanomyces euteiches]KAH9139596.1 hypothetical protein AeRB84_016120 [Aphanomyces euteiches]
MALSTAVSGQSKLYVCSASVPAMIGTYEIDDELISDDAPVYTRVDPDDYNYDADPANDFRLFRHRGFWSFADFASWPPEVHFRCDPHLNDQDQACRRNQAAPPLEGYSPRLGTELHSPVVQLQPCLPELTHEF